MHMIVIDPISAFIILYLTFSFGSVIGFIRRGQIERAEREKNAKKPFDQLMDVMSGNKK